ncbi:MAG: hypothetical protein Q7S11_02285 [bacterium]|nr:hypothetical protein [bacterium]
MVDYEFIGTTGKSLSTYQFLYKDTFHAKNLNKGHYSCSLIEGKFLIFESKTKIFVCIWKADIYNKPTHGEIVEQFRNSCFGDFILIGSGRIKWKHRYCMTHTVPTEPITQFGSLSCNPDRPDNHDLEEKYIDAINNFVMKVYIDTLADKNS